MIHEQLDYVFFTYGLAFVLLGAICATMDRRGGQRLPWGLLAWFGFLHGINEWLDMFALVFGDGDSFRAVRLAALAVSYVFLVEFGRKGLPRVGGVRLGLWVYLPLACCAVLCGLTGSVGMDAGLRYTFGLAGGAGAALALWKAAANARAGSFYLAVAGVAMAAYALATGYVVPSASFFPASVVNHTAFLAATNLPIQTIRGVLALLVATAVWAYCQRVWKAAVALDIGPVAMPRHGRQLFYAMLVILVGGWVLTEDLSRREEQFVQRAALRQSGGLVASVDVARHVAERRLEGILATFLVVVPCLVVFVLRQRAWQAGQSLAAGERRLAEAQRLAHVGSWTYDTADGVLRWSDELHRILGRDPARGAPTVEEFAAFVHPDDRERWSVCFRKVVESGEGCGMDYRIVRSDGQTRHIHSEVVTRLGERGECLRLAGIAQDITDRKLAEERLRDISQQDTLTGLHNRRGFFERGGQMLETARRLGHGLTLVFADMDGLKAINDTLGHEQGDRALVDVAALLTDSFRKSDIIARVGGDEFVVLTLNTSDTPSQPAIERLRRSVADHASSWGRPYRIALSVGVVHLDPDDPLALDVHMARADRLMYEEKTRRREVPSSGR